MNINIMNINTMNTINIMKINNQSRPSKVYKGKHVS